AAEVHELLGTVTKPVVVGAGAIDPDGGPPAVNAPADHLVTCPGRGAARLDRDPRVDREDAAPAHRARGIDLHDRLGRPGRIGRLARGTALELPPVRSRALEHRAPDERREEQQAEPARTAVAHPPSSSRTAAKGRPYRLPKQMCTAIFAFTPSTARFTPLLNWGAAPAYMPLWGSSIWMKSQPAATSARHSAVTIATRSASSVSLSR